MFWGRNDTCRDLFSRRPSFRFLRVKIVSLQISKEEYDKIQADLLSIGLKTHQLDLFGFLCMIETCKQEGPLLDGPLFSKAQKRLAFIEKIATHAIEIRHAYGALKNEVLRDGLPDISFCEVSGVKIDRAD